MKMKALAMAICSLGLAALPVHAQDDRAQIRDNTEQGAAAERSPEVATGTREDEQINARNTEGRDESAAGRDSDAPRNRAVIGDRQNELADSNNPDDPGAADQADRDVREDVREAADIIGTMQQDTELAQQLESARGLFILPNYAAASLIVGGAGGEGVLITREDGEWSHPGFYNIGSATLGVQAGVEAGAIVMLLMTEDAVNSFNSESTFSLDANAGLSLINWSTRAQTQTGELEGDVIVWSDTAGLLGEVSIGFTNIRWDEEENQEYYGELIMPQQVIGGSIETERENVLGQRLSG